MKLPLRTLCVYPYECISLRCEGSIESVDAVRSDTPGIQHVKNFSTVPLNKQEQLQTIATPSKHKYDLPMYLVKLDKTTLLIDKNIMKSSRVWYTISNPFHAWCYYSTVAVRGIFKLLLLTSVNNISHLITKATNFGCCRFVFVSSSRTRTASMGPRGRVTTQRQRSQ